MPQPITFSLRPTPGFPLLSPQRASPPSNDGTRLWLPSDLGTKLKTWLKGDDLAGTNGSSITTWADATSNANDATGAANKPTLVTSGLNGINTVAFAGASGQYFTLPTGMLAGRTQSASFAVYKLTASPPVTFAGPVFGDFGTDANSNHNPYTDGNFYDDYCSTARRTITGVPASTLFRIFGLRSQANDWRLDINGTNYYTDATNTVGVSSAPLIGRTASAGVSLDGQIAEIVDCNNFLTTAEKEQVEGYLAWKWGLEGYLPIGHTYAATAPRIATVGSSTGTGASTEDTDTTTGSGTVAISGSGASAEAADTTAASGTAAIAGTGAATESADTTNASGTVAVSASGASTEAPDTTVASGTAAVSASGASTEGTDSGGGTGATSVSATGASAEGADTTTAAGAASVTGSGSCTEATDAASGAGATPVAASGASTEGTDNGSGGGTVAQAGSAGTGASVEASDATSGSGIVAVSGVGAANDNDDICLGDGTAAAVLKFWRQPPLIGRRTSPSRSR